MRNEGRDSQCMLHLQMLTRRLLETLMDQSDGILDGSWHVGQDDMSDEGKEFFSSYSLFSGTWSRFCTFC